MMNAFRLTDVAKSFKGRPVIEDASFEVGIGEAVALTGPNGSGKSVLLRICCSILKPDHGEVWINPEFVDAGASLPSKFGCVIDRPGFIPQQTGFDNLAGLARIRGAIGDREISAAMERVGLDPHSKTPAGRYSLGMRQKLALAQAFMEGQSVLLLDEPFNGLDRASVESVHELLQELHREGRTILFTSHHEQDVVRLAQRRIEIDAGRVHAVEAA